MWNSCIDVVKLTRDEMKFSGSEMKSPTHNGPRTSGVAKVHPGKKEGCMWLVRKVEICFRKLGVMDS